MDPYVQVKVRGHPLDKQKQRTKVVKNNGKFVKFLHYVCQSINGSLHPKLFSHFFMKHFSFSLLLLVLLLIIFFLHYLIFSCAHFK